jgi:hypothetical protein
LTLDERGETVARVRVTERTDDALEQARRVAPIQQAAAGPSSRDSAAGAGWDCGPAGKGAYKDQIPGRSFPFSWLNPVPLVQSRNDRLARRLGDPVDEIRRAWVARQFEQGRATEDFAVTGHETKTSISFVLIGDTGEGDASQYALVPVLEAAAGDTDFMVIVSDVIYPAAGVSEYEDKFYWPYTAYNAPIYAIPGNHDWYDDLVAFMTHFCGVGLGEPPPAVQGPGGALKRRVRNRLWRRPKRRDTPGDFGRMRALRARPEQQGSQPGPYFALDTGPVLLVAIDPGITARIDREQAEWLRRISSASSKPKILLTGKPIYVDGEHNPGDVEGSETAKVDDVVCDPANNYIAAVGGDIHNYQRYPVHVGGRTLQYMVSGGGGAYTHTTHTIPNIDTTEISDVTSEAEFRCYPLRGDSLSMFSQLYERKLGRVYPGSLFVPPKEASRLVGERLGMLPTRESDRAVEISASSRRAFDRIFPREGRVRGPWHHYVSEFLDWNEPPMFKSFLRVDAADGEILFTCFSATGCRRDEEAPRIEDAVLGTRDAEDRWSWRNVEAEEALAASRRIAASPNE